MPFAVLLFFPLPTYAANCSIYLNSLSHIISFILCIIGWLIPVIVALALVLFIWYIITYVINQGNAEERGKAAQTMIWGIIAIFVMVSVWGLVQFVTYTLGWGFIIPQLQ